MDTNTKKKFKAVRNLQPGDRVIALSLGEFLFEKGVKLVEFRPGMTGTVFREYGFHGEGLGAEVRWDAGNMNTVYDGEVALVEEVMEIVTANAEFEE